jgi:RNA polymerase sigma factor (sigma-70 family)
MVADTLARTVTRLVAAGAGPDADLLRRFVAARDEDAFAQLVRRHGPMVFGVCRRTLGHQQDAEDAFQATFLVLARKAHAVRPDGVSRWLYGVAVRVANKARTRRARRLPTPADLNEVPARPSPPPADWLPLLDAALARLSDRDRGPIVLCDLLGRSRTEAAAELGIGEGTLSSRLARARDKLRARLMRMGVVPGVLTVAGLAPEPVPASLTESTRVAASAAARDLAEGVIRSMALAKLTKLAALGVCAVGLVTGISLVPTAGAGPTSAAKDAPKGPPPREADVGKPARSDAERFLGTWVVESALPNGETRHVPGWVGERMTFERDKVRFAGFVGKEKEYKLDPGWDQKRIDFTLTYEVDGAPTQRWHMPGIYRFEGEKLHLVLGFTHRPERPDSFDRVEQGMPFDHLILRKLGDGQVADDERKALEGTWVMVAAEQGGERKAMTGTSLILKGDRFTIRHADDRPGTEGEYTVDATPVPRHIDLTVTAGGPGPVGTVVRGVYTRSGELLTLRLNEQGSDRPKTLIDKSGPPTLYFVHEGTDAKLVDGLLPKVVPARVRELQRRRVAALEAQHQGLFERVKIGKEPLGALLMVIQELADAELELATTREARMAALEKALRSMNECVKELEDLQAAGLQTKQGVAQAKAAALKVEIEYEKLKAEK